MNKNDRILLLGGSGMLGQAMQTRLRIKGFDYIDAPSHQMLDLEQQPQVNNWFKEHEYEVVILAAGKTGGIISNRDYPADYLSKNLTINLNVINAIQHKKSKLVLFASSCMYPNPCQQPMHEDLLWSGRPEATSIAYATAKLAAVEYCLALNRQQKTKRFIPLIPNTLYGPNDHFNSEHAHVMAALINKVSHANEQQKPSLSLWGSGKPKREFLYVDDLADAVIHILSLSQDAVPTLPINVGSGMEISIQHLAELIKTGIGYTGSIEWDTTKPDGALRKLLDSQRIHDSDWSASTSLENGVEKSIAWYNSRH